MTATGAGLSSEKEHLKAHWRLYFSKRERVYEYAFTLVHQLDPMSEGRDVLQLKTGLSSMISKKRMQREGQKLDRTDDIHVISDYYKKYWERHDIANLEDEERKQ